MWAPISVTNTGTTAWDSQVKVTYWWQRQDDSVALYGDRHALPQTVAPGGTLATNLYVSTPGPGSYQLHLTVLREPSDWFDQGVNVQVTVT